MTKPKLEILDQLLDRERAALLAGDLAAMTDLAEQKEKILNDMTNADRAGLAKLQGKAQRNSELLDSAMTGIRSVIDRLQALRDARRTLETYDQNGLRHSIESHPRMRIERRA